MNAETHRELPGIPDIPADQRTAAVVLLLEHCHRQQEQIQALRDEIARLKGQKPKPVIRRVCAGRQANRDREGAPAATSRQAQQDGKA
jgi:hypothetical protein